MAKTANTQTKRSAPSSDISPADISPSRLNLVAVSELLPTSDNPRRHSRPQLQAIAKSIKAFGFNAPILVNKDNQIIAGHGRFEAAKLIGLTRVPVISLDHLNESQARAYMLADNKLTDRSTWDDTKVAVHLKELSDLAIDFDIEDIGFEIPEIDFRILSLDTTDADLADEFQTAAGPATSISGDLWLLGQHRIYCGSALDAAAYDILFKFEKAAAVFTDPPYNVRIDGHVGGKGAIKHREFAMASGEMNEDEFISFLSGTFAFVGNYSNQGALIYGCMDWRHMGEMLSAGRSASFDLLNLCVWAKSNGGMGSFYRSRHELIFVYRNGKQPHLNNVQLGRFGRNRTNVWNYHGANGFAQEGRDRDLALHPTVKPVALVADALLDSTRRKDIVLDPFLGSGTTVLAAERTGRRCYGIELDPLYVDTAIERWERVTGLQANHESGDTFAKMKISRG